MTEWDKLIAKILTLSKDLRFDELRKVLESYGYEMHAPRSGPIKKVYVEMVRQIVESEASNNENA